MKNFLLQEMERCKKAMEAHEPTTQEYKLALDSLMYMATTLHLEYEQTKPMVIPAPGAETEKPARESGNAPEGNGKEGNGPTIKKEDVRAELADARLKGIDVSALIASVGASNLSGVDPAKYPDLLERLHKELGGQA